MKVEAASELEALLHAMYDAGVLIDGTGRVLEGNRAFARLMDIKPRELTERAAAGLQLGELLLPTGGVDLAADLARCVTAGRAVQFADIAVARADGEELILWVSCTPLTGRALVVLRDVSSEARMQARLRELLESEKRRAAELERSVELRTAELRQALVEVMRLAHTDPLTELHNRRAFTERADRALRTARRRQRTHALCLLDLDLFKTVNDTWGHEAGDRLLIAVAGALKKTLRDTDVLARIGGEEFAVLLEEVSSQAAHEVAERMRAAVAAIDLSEIMPERRMPQTVSVGLAMFDRDGATLDALLRAADGALYRAKAAGRDAVVAAGGEPTAGEDRGRTALVCLQDAARLVAGLPDHEVIVREQVHEAQLALASQSFDVVVAGATRAGLELLEDSCWRSPAALRLLVFDDGEQLSALDGAPVSVVDGLIRMRDAEDSLHSCLELAGARRQVLGDSVLRRLPARLSSTGSAVGVDEATLRVVLEGRFDVALQPIVSLTDRPFNACELLLRPPGGVSPSDVCAVAQERGLLGRLGRQVRRRAAQILAQRPELTLFVNVDSTELLDPVSFEAEPELLAVVDRVVLEITERTSFTHMQRAPERLARLHELGFRLAIDDLGTGYASLSALATLAPKFVKIDREFVAGIAGSPLRRRLVELLARLAREHDIVSVAEGIETEAELRVVRELGCELAQGYYLGRPEIWTD
jgi:diguanylate cyclase (GGDEF)-like protein